MDGEIWHIYPTYPNNSLTFQLIYHSNMESHPLKIRLSAVQAIRACTVARIESCRFLGKGVSLIRDSM